MTIWAWLIYTLLGLVLVGFLPDKSRPIAIIVIVLGGIVYLQQHGGSVQDLIDTLQGKKNEQ